MDLLLIQARISTIRVKQLVVRPVSACTHFNSTKGYHQTSCITATVARVPAKPYFTKLGFECPERSTVAEYLCASNGNKGR